MLLSYNNLMELERFEGIVTRAVSMLTQELMVYLENVDIVVQDYPTQAQSERAPGTVLLGLYEGIPLTRRGLGYSLVLPDKITIFQKPLEELYSSDSELEKAIHDVVLHELAHHFGMDDQQLSEIEERKLQRGGKDK